MWQVLAHPHGGHYVYGALSEGISMMFVRVGSAPVFLSIASHKAEPRAFDKARLPIIAVDGEHVFDLNKEMEYQRTNTNLNWCFSEARTVGARIWAGDQITPTATILKFLAGSTVSVRLFFDPFEMGEYNLSLNGFGDALQQSFGVTIGQDPATQASGMGRRSVSPSDVTVDRDAVRSMVEDFWRSFISVAANHHPVTGLRIIKNFDKRIQATASSMDPVKGRIFLRAVEEERDLLFNEYRRNPDALKHRLGLAPIRQPTVVPHRNQRQSIGEMAVRTAVRATIWETVFSLFRAFR